MPTHGTAPSPLLRGCSPISELQRSFAPPSRGTARNQPNHSRPRRGTQRQTLLRTKRAVQLTAAGTAFLREAQEILRRANEAQHLAQRAARGEVGTLGIG